VNVGFPDSILRVQLANTGWFLAAAQRGRLLQSSMLISRLPRVGLMLNRSSTRQPCEVLPCGIHGEELAHRVVDYTLTG
jgi:hypothetical protein